MEIELSRQEIQQAASHLAAKISTKPKVAIVLGSGLGRLAKQIENPTIIPYADIPHWPESTVPGHQGQLVAGQLENRPVFVLQGRFHFYEGYSMSQVAFPMRVLKLLGVEILIMTNAAGGINQSLNPGDIMLVKDHIGIATMAGFHPLRGKNLDGFGPRFPDMSQAYDRQLTAWAEEVAQVNHIPVHKGVYFGLAGPSYETPAELRFISLIGGDVVGMSTVSEVIVARHSGIRVLAISGITNKTSLTGDHVTSHEEVIETGDQIIPKIETIIRGVLQKI